VNAGAGRNQDPLAQLDQRVPNSFYWQL